MPSLIKQGEAKIVTKNGEVFVNIALELTIKLEGTNLQGPVSASGGALSSPIAKQDEEKVNWEIPDFSPSKINFGK
jgi:hypothetical protein